MKREGLNRLILVLSICGSIYGGYLAYENGRALIAHYKRFNAYMNTQTIKDLKPYLKNDNWHYTITRPNALGINEIDTDTHGIVTIRGRWNFRDYVISRPEVSLYDSSIIIYPMLGFLLPFLFINAIIWINNGFKDNKQ